VTRPTANLELAIELDSDPITGSVSNGHAGSRPFRGWIELVAEIEAARSSSAGVNGIGGADQVGAKTLGLIPGAKATKP
jgi:hypothetical protein